MSLQSRRLSPASVARDRKLVNFHGSGSRYDIIRGPYPRTWETEYSHQYVPASDELLEGSFLETQRPPYPPEWLLQRRAVSGGVSPVQADSSSYNIYSPPRHSVRIRSNSPAAESRQPSREYAEHVRRQERMSDPHSPAPRLHDERPNPYAPTDSEYRRPRQAQGGEAFIRGRL